MDVMLENYLRRFEANQERTIKLLEGIGAELVLQRKIPTEPVRMTDEQAYRLKCQTTGQHPADEVYKNGFNDGQAEGMPEALKAERERVLDELCEWLRYNNPISTYHHIKNNMRSEPYRSRPLSEEHIWMTPEEEEKRIRKSEMERVLDEFKWMRPMCFGRHDATCDTRCAWVVRKQCIESLRSEQP